MATIELALQDVGWLVGRKKMIEPERVLLAGRRVTRSGASRLKAHY